MKELTEVVNRTLGLLVGGVVVASLLGSILPTVGLFFAERREARLGHYLGARESSARRPVRTPAVAPESSQAGEEVLAGTWKPDTRGKVEGQARADR